jgi:hypothetical protein
LPGAHFIEQESTVGYRRVLRDKELAGKQEPTQLGRVLANLGVEMRYALSAPAKGRVERLWGVLQDRLISELRLAGASTRGQANQVLSE